jgi:hypothetical protein
MNKSTIVAATIAFLASLASATAQPERGVGETMTKAVQCFNYSERSKWEGRLRVLFWMQRASPCQPPLQRYGAE